ncbi:hypothetical protein CFR71_07680 [Novacetimonas pomaceti]|uniref:Uncharacterized protein n=2 Tax=Novacetimonas pomaceti TaxID=2021998 RepID=A0A318QDP3_9PROT|nr:hypothetical protein CFR71_07680 [Novacetimonas pomaceti]
MWHAGFACLGIRLYSGNVTTLSDHCHPGPDARMHVTWTSGAPITESPWRHAGDDINRNEAAVPFAVMKDTRQLPVRPGHDAPCRAPGPRMRGW